MLAKYVNPDYEIEQRCVAKQQNDVKNGFTFVMSVYYEQVYTDKCIQKRKEERCCLPLFSLPNRYEEQRKS